MIAENFIHLSIQQLRLKKLKVSFSFFKRKKYNWLYGENYTFTKNDSKKICWHMVFHESSLDLMAQKELDKL